MVSSCNPDTGQERAEARRLQILSAAAECFRRGGFHKTSVAEIARTAGMSVGHIYHYFDGKEAIIASIVERDFQLFLERIAAFRQSSDPLGTMLDGVEEGIDDCLDMDTAVLTMEVLAESARNPKIAGRVRVIEDTLRSSLIEIIQLVRKDAEPLPEVELASRAVVISAIFDGLKIRAIRNPDIDRNTVLAIIRKTMYSLILM